VLSLAKEEGARLREEGLRLRLEGERLEEKGRMSSKRAGEAYGAVMELEAETAVIKDKAERRIEEAELKAKEAARREDRNLDEQRLALKRLRVAKVTLDVKIGQAREMVKEELAGALARAINAEARAKKAERSAAQFAESSPEKLRYHERERAALNNKIHEKEVALSKSKCARARVQAECERAQGECKRLSLEAGAHVSFPSVSGRGGAWDGKWRVVFMELLTLDVPPNSVKEAFGVIAVALLGEERCSRDLRLPDDNFYRELRTELAGLGQSVNALALSRGTLRSVGVDASPFRGDEILATSLQIEEGELGLRRWSGGGATQIADMTAQGEAKAVEAKVKGLDNQLAIIKVAYELINGVGSMPAEEPVGMANFKNCVLINDNASTALSTAKQLGEMIAKAVEESFGAERWGEMTPEEQAAAAKVYCANCHRHLPNTYLDGGCAEELVLLANKLKESLLDPAAKRLRLTGDLTSILYSLAKGLGEGSKTYAHGLGAAMRAFLERNHPKILYFPVVRTEMGARQDAKTEAAQAVYFNRPRIVEFLKDATYPGGGGILKDNMLASLTSLEVIAALRGRAAINEKFTVRVRFFSASNELDGWSVLEMAAVSDCARAFWKLCEENPAAVLTHDYDPFKSIVHPAYTKFLRALSDSPMCSVDGSLTFKDWAEIRREIYDPTDEESKKATSLTLECLQAWGRGAGKTMDNGEAQKYMEGGVYGVDNQTDAMRVAFKGTVRNTNDVESLFGIIKYVENLHTNISIVNANAVATAKFDQIFPKRGRTYVQRRKGKGAKLAGRSSMKKYKREAERKGRLFELKPKIIAAVVLAARQGKKAVRAAAGIVQEAAKARLEARRAAVKTSATEKVAESYAKAIRCFAHEPICPDKQVSSKVPLGTLARSVERKLGGGMSENQQELALQNDLDRYYCGMSLDKPKDFTKTSKDRPERRENIAFLKRTLFELYAVVRASGIVLPSKAVLAEGAGCRVLPVLGTKSRDDEPAHLPSFAELLDIAKAKGSQRTENRALKRAARGAPAVARKQQKKQARRCYPFSDDELSEGESSDEEMSDEEEEEEGEIDEALQPNATQSALVDRTFSDVGVGQDAFVGMWRVERVHYDEECQCVVAIVYPVTSRERPRRECNAATPTSKNRESIGADELLAATWVRWSSS
jgi:hypothetical protein